MLKHYFKLLRPSHWIKNLFVFVPLLFAKHLFNWDYFGLVLLAFVAFSFAASIVYIINDILDLEYDRVHPIKKNRPLASAEIPRNSAYFLILLLSVLTLLILSVLNIKFALAVACYVTLNILYSIKLKDIVILDLLIIAAGFMLRILAGAFVINIYVSNWLILTTLFLSLFLAVMKRRSEIKTLSGISTSRNVLKDYSNNFIDQISAVSAGGVIICYALYSVDERTINFFNTESIVFSTVFVVFGIFRYMFLVYEKSKGENPVEIMLTDLPMIINILLYIFVVVLIIYLDIRISM